jgi:hypothetical protein
MATFTTNLEVDVEVDYSVDGENVPARIYGRAEDCHPAEFAEIDLDAVWVTLSLPNGKTRRVDILPVLDSKTEQALKDDAEWRAAEEITERYHDAMERKADEARGC